MMINFENVSKRIPGGFAVKDLDLSVSAQETVVLFGPSGCGKTTTLRLIAGFEEPDQGVLHINGKQTNKLFRSVPPHHRNVSMVFQDLALWPHMTVQQHLSFVWNARPGRRGKSQKETMAGDILAQVRLSHKTGNYPHQLSGGEKQRLALARAFVAQPKVLLMDEPLSSLDAHLRSILLRDIRSMIQRWKTTTVYVTHDWREALFLADRVAVMRDGRIIRELDPQQRHNMTCSEAASDVAPIQNKKTQSNDDGNISENPSRRKGRLQG